MQRKREPRVVRTRSGELFIETGPREWKNRLAAWDADHSQPCPLPTGHRIFRYPEEYGAEFIRPA